MTALATLTGPDVPGPSPRFGPSCATLATPATRCGDVSAATKYSSTSTMSPPGTSPECAGTTPTAGSGRPGHLPSRPGSHRRPITTQPPDPTGNAAALPAPWAAALRTLPAAPPGSVDPRRGLLPLPLPRRVRRRFRLPTPKVRLP